jgi:hypothetical protein
VCEPADSELKSILAIAEIRAKRNGDGAQHESENADF